MIPLSEVIRTLRAKKSLGQNFLSDPSILKRITDSAAPLENCTVIEVGSGPGGLSREIIKHACREVILIEQDERCIPYLEPLKECFGKPFTIINKDALNLPLYRLGTPPRKIIANLPYNVSVPLLLDWLKHMDAFESLTLMFQQEVAARLIASPNTSDYGRLSVMCQWKAHVKKVFNLPAGAFIPPPKVTSTVVHLTPRLPRENVSWEALEKVTKASFSQRRKMLRASLKSLVKSPLALLEAAHIQPERRAETLSIEEFARLATAWEKSEYCK